MKHNLHRALDAVRAFILVLWWMAVAFAGIFVFYLMTKSPPG